MLGNGVEMSLIYCGILGPLDLGWAPNHFVLGAQLAPGEKRLDCIPASAYQRSSRCNKTSKKKQFHKDSVIYKIAFLSFVDMPMVLSTY